MVARANQWARFNVTEAERHPVPLQVGKFVGRVPPGDRQMLIGWTQVLSQRDDVHSLRAQVTNRREQLVPLLPQSADESRFGEQLGIHLLRPLEQLQRARVPATGPRDAI